MTSNRTHFFKSRSFLCSFCVIKLFKTKLLFSFIFLLEKVTSFCMCDAKKDASKLFLYIYTQQIHYTFPPIWVCNSCKTMVLYMYITSSFRKNSFQCILVFVRSCSMSIIRSFFFFCSLLSDPDALGENSLCTTI